MLSLPILAAFATFNAQVFSAPSIVRPSPRAVDPEPGHWILQDLRYRSWGNDKRHPDNVVKQKIALNLTRDGILAECTGDWNLADNTPRLLNCTTHDDDVEVHILLDRLTVTEGRERSIQPLNLTLTEYGCGSPLPVEPISQELYEFDDIERDNKERVDAAKAEIKRYKKAKKDKKDKQVIQTLEKDLKRLKRDLKPGYGATNNTGLLCRPETLTHSRYWSFWTSYKDTPKSVECMYMGYNRELPLEF